MNLPTKQKQTHRHSQQICGCQEALGVGGVMDEQMQTII